ncbi:MAG: NfuA family Fe-S biogenesis protein [Rudaea sp.]
MLNLSENAQNHFARLIKQQEIDGLGVRVTAISPGTSKADCRLEFCEISDLSGDEWALQCDGFMLYVDAASMAYLEGAEVDFQVDATGGQLTVRAPKLKGTPPPAGADLAEKVRFLIDSEINPQIASHGGRVSLVQIEPGNVVVLKFGGGCHGCGMADVTLKQGIERTLRTQLPEITQVRDATDHGTGENPYFKDKTGASAVG